MANLAFNSVRAKLIAVAYDPISISDDRRHARRIATADNPMLASDDDILRIAQDWAENDRGVAIATVIETWGSAPRPVGSHLVIDSDGRFLGSVSGGCVEADVMTEALDVIATGKPQMLEFGVADETAWKAGLSCGGRIKIYVERIG